jgi:hypothetical protein
MGGGRGGGYSDSSSEQVASNFRSLETRFGPPSSGRYGTPGSSKSVRRISSTDPDATAKEFFDIASRGGKVTEIKPGVYRAKFKNGTYITYRKSSKSDGSPAITINPGEKSQHSIRPHKIHFVEDSQS